jgi:hypothetical protein
MAGGRWRLGYVGENPAGSISAHLPLYLYFLIVHGVGLKYVENYIYFPMLHCRVLNCSSTARFITSLSSLLKQKT